jgi:hypothetical protein
VIEPFMAALDGLMLQIPNSGSNIDQVLVLQDLELRAELLDSKGCRDLHTLRSLALDWIRSWISYRAELGDESRGGLFLPIFNARESYIEKHRELESVRE